MTDKAVVVISFEGPERFPEILQKVKGVFEGDDTVLVYGAVRETSEEIIDILSRIEIDHQSERK